VMLYSPSFIVRLLLVTSPWHDDITPGP